MDIECTDIAEMVRNAVADLQEDRAQALRVPTLERQLDAAEREMIERGKDIDTLRTALEGVALERDVQEARAHAWELGMGVRDDWQGKGVGTRLMETLIDLADQWLGALRVELTVYCENERAIALYRKFGFEIEGRYRAYALREGRLTDSYAMARLNPHPPQLPAPDSSNA